jgi:signal transduction histidine kinase
MINLVKNAHKFSVSNGRINIKACYNEQVGYLVVHIEDTGAGISKEDMPRLFTRFGKLHRTAEINSAGIGLGLMIVKQIVESSQGQITVESEGVGRGSTFIFSMAMR